MNFSTYTPKPALKFATLPVLALLLQITLLPGCSTHSAVMVKQVQEQTSDQQRVQQVMDALKITESRIAKAGSNNVELFAPSQMQEAKRALAEARRYYEQFQANPNKVNESISLFFSDSMGGKALALIAEADAALTQAEAIKSQADTVFSESNENFVWLKKFQAPVHFRYAYQDLEDTQKQLIEYVASGRLEAAQQNLPQLLQEQRALETAAAQRFYLFEISHRIEKQEQYTLDRYAPSSYSSAVGALNKARAVIAKNTRDEKAILAAKADAVFSVEIAHAVALDMKKLVDMDRREMERWLILLTTKLHAMAQTIGAADVRNHQVVQQVDLLTAAAKQSGTIASQVTTAAVVAAPSPDVTTINDRMAQLEQTLGEQVKALSEQLNAIKAENKRAEAVPTAAPAAADADTPQAPPAKRPSLFGN